MSPKAKTSLLIILLLAICGFALGLGSVTFIYGKGYSYLLDDPKACVNCHVMRDQYDSWNKSSHHKVATCNSCHTPENIYFKYFNKMDNGFMHALKFTTGTFKDPIRIRQHNFNITMQACLKCHGDLMSSTLHQEPLREGRSCVACHREVGHTH
ncbi:MAG: cytochrome c nitrite reductase small subunit [Bacteriovoracaceae bacterium]|nr:cytochrome c nitrite reductase small subunit [Bacteriovoracaceae bacterium]